VRLTPENKAYHAHSDHRHGVLTGLELSIRIDSNEFARNPDGTGIKGGLLKGGTDLCKQCHKKVIQWYLDHIEPGSSI